MDTILWIFLFIRKWWLLFPFSLTVVQNPSEKCKVVNSLYLLTPKYFSMSLSDFQVQLSRDWLTSCQPAGLQWQNLISPMELSTSVLNFAWELLLSVFLMPSPPPSIAKLFQCLYWIILKENECPSIFIEIYLTLLFALSLPTFIST